MAAIGAPAPEPRHIPGYAGHCPEYRFRIGDSFSSATHKILLDPNIYHAEKMILSDRTKDDFQVYRPPKDMIDIVNARHKTDYLVYQHPMVPGYEGFVPRLRGQVGQRFAVSATEAMSDYELECLRQRTARKQLTLATAGVVNPTALGYVPKSQFRLPLYKVRPECIGILKDICVDEPIKSPPRSSPCPYYKDKVKGLEPDRSEVLGAIKFFRQPQGDIKKTSFIGETPTQRVIGPEDPPITLLRPDVPITFDIHEIYHSNIGMLPNYAGHVPGYMFRQGKTYGSETRDAKRWFRGDFLP